MMAKRGAKEVGLSIFMKKLSLCKPVRLKIQPVIVVPMFAPMMIGIAWVNFMMPEFTKPTTMTVEAEEDWMTAVTPAPNKTPLYLLEVRFSSIDFSRCPEIRAKLSPINSIPYKKRASPPRRVRTLKISTIYHLFIIHTIYLLILC